MNDTISAVPDALTGLPGHEACLAAFDAQLVEAVQAQGAVSMALVDLDRFAAVNKDHGRAVGDEVLKALAEFLDRFFAGKGQVFRYGGDAFAVLLPGTEKEAAFLLLEAARADFEGEREIAGEGGAVNVASTVTVGVAAYPDDGTVAHEIARKANEALYRGKVGGRNKVCLAREEKMVTKTSHYTQGQLHGLSRIAKRAGLGEAVLLREALDDLLRKYNA